MARRQQQQRDLDVAMGLAQVAALIVLFWVLFPSGRDLLATKVLVLVGVVVLVVFASLIILLTRKAEKPPGYPASSANFAPTKQPSPGTSLPPTSNLTETKPELTANCSPE